MPFSSKEKVIGTVEVYEHAPSSQSDINFVSDQGSQGRILAERRLVRKLDMRFLPMVTLIYLMNYIDVSCSSSHTDLPIYFVLFSEVPSLQRDWRGLKMTWALRVLCTFIRSRFLLRLASRPPVQYHPFCSLRHLQSISNSIEYGNSFSQSKWRLSNLLCAQDLELRSEVMPLWIGRRTLRSLRFRPSLYIGGCVIAWGVVSAFTGVSIVLYNITPAHLIFDVIRSPTPSRGYWSVDFSWEFQR